MDDLRGKRVVIIGGSGGFGLATAIAAAELGAHVIVASSNQARIDSALAKLPKEARGIVVDASSEAALKALFETVGEIDHLVYTAGDPTGHGGFVDTPAELAQQVFGVRFWGAYSAARFARIRAGGSITFTSATSGMRPNKGWTLAACICGAMEALTRSLAIELAPTRVNCVRAGAVDTELWDRLGYQRQGVLDALAQRTTVGRVGRPGDLGAAYLFLLRNGFASGSVVTVDGGALLV